MKKIISIFTLFLISLTSFSEQKLPQLFIDAEADHIKNIRDIAISPNGNDIYFTHQDPDMTFSVIYFVQPNGTPKKAPFSGEHLDMEPFFAPHNNFLYFVSDRPHANNLENQKNFDIWCVELSYRDSIQPVHPEATYNTSANEFYPSFTNDGDLFFTSDMEGTKGKDDIFYCKFENGNYSKPISLSDSINTDGSEYNAFIAPDGSYIIFGAYKRADGFGSGDLYISYSLPNGEWTKAKNLGSKVNSAAMDYCPFVDKNGELYFTSKRGILELKSEKEQVKENKKFPGGRSRLYSISRGDWLAN